MFTASAFVSVILAAGAALPLRVEITSSKTRVSIFEPVKLTVRATAIQPVFVPPTADTAGSPAMETWVDYGEGFVEYVDEPRQMGYGVGGGVGRGSLLPGETLVRTVVLVEGRIGEQLTVPFPTPGRPALRVVFRARPERDGMSGAVLGESDALSFEVVAPDTEGQQVVERIRAKPWILRGALDYPEYDALVKQFPASPYLHWGKRAIALEKDARIHNGRYPDTDEKFASMGHGSPLAPPLYRELATELLEAESWGQFDEERLQLAAEIMERAGDLAAARGIWMEIVERFPGSEAAEKAKSRIDTTPPSLQLAASPAALWPPSHRLEPITVSVQVTDDQDPNPRVKLVSITCDDGCVPANDIVGAGYGMDDRSFELRSERKGFGAGRTYTITCEARDAAGNKATATTTVTVPHDQGGVATKKK
jgi:hypothetical protein